MQCVYRKNDSVLLKLWDGRGKFSCELLLLFFLLLRQADSTGEGAIKSTWAEMAYGRMIAMSPGSGGREGFR